MSGRNRPASPLAGSVSRLPALTGAKRTTAQSRFGFGVALGNCSLQTAKEEDVLAIAGTGYGVIGILVIILLVVLILYFVRRA